MKSGTIYFGMVTVFMLLVVVGVAMYVSGGFQMLWDDYGLVGVAGFIVVFLLASMAFMLSVRRSLKQAMTQGPLVRGKCANERVGEVRWLGKRNRPSLMQSR